MEQLGRRRGAGLAVDRDAGLGAALDNGEPRVESGAAPGIGPTVDGHGEDGARGAVGEGVAPGGIAGDAVGRGDGGEPAARRQHREGRADMAQIGVVADAVDPRRRRERRVHQHDRRPDAGQEVGEGLGVVAGDGGAGKQPREQPGADGRYLVQMQVSGGAAPHGALRHHGEHAGPCRGLQHGVAGADGGGPEGGIGEGERGRDLLEANLVLGALRVRGLQGGDRREHRQHFAGVVRIGACPLAHGAPVTLDEQHDGGLRRLVGVLPDPGAGGGTGGGVSLWRSGMAVSGCGRENAPPREPGTGRGWRRKCGQAGVV